MNNFKLCDLYTVHCTIQISTISHFQLFWIFFIGLSWNSREYHLNSDTYYIHIIKSRYFKQIRILTSGWTWVLFFSLNKTWVHNIFVILAMNISQLYIHDFNSMVFWQLEQKHLKLSIEEVSIYCMFLKVVSHFFTLKFRCLFDRCKTWM